MPCLPDGDEEEEEVEEDDTGMKQQPLASHISQDNSRTSRIQRLLHMPEDSGQSLKESAPLILVRLSY